MYMNMKYIFMIVVFTCLLSSCYEDKGNYDYQQMNDITINLSLPDGKTKYSLGDVLEISPELAFAKGFESENLTYSWTFDRKEISTDRNLKWLIDEEGENSHIRLAVKDENTGVTYFESVLVSVTSRYAENGWVVLSKNEDGTSMLTYLEQTTKEVENENKEKEKVYDCIVAKNIYGSMNGGGSLGGQPVSLTQHFVSFWSSDGPEDLTSWLWLVQKGGEGCIDISGSSYQIQGSLPAMFVNGGYPQGFEPQRVYDMMCYTMAIGEDGTIYTRIKDSYTLFNSSYFVNDVPLSYEQQPVDGTMMARTMDFYDRGGALFYDKNSKRYFHIGDYAILSFQSSTGTYVLLKYSGKLMLPIVDDKIYESDRNLARLDDMSGYNIYYLGAYADNKYKSVIEKGGEIYIQDFKVNQFSGKNTVTVADYTQKRATELDPLIKGGVKNVYSLCYQQNTRPYLLIGHGKTLYLYKFDAPEGSRLIEYQSFDSEITGIDVYNIITSGHAGVGLANGEFYVLSLAKDVIQKIIDGTAKTEDKVLFKQDGLGTIVEVIFKYKQALNWP